MVMLEFLKDKTWQADNPRIDLPAVTCVLRDEAREIDWDDAWDTLDYLSSSYQDDLSLLYELAQDQNADYTARSYAVAAMVKIDNKVRECTPVLTALLQDKEADLRSEAAAALKECNIQEHPEVVPALAAAAKGWRSTIGAQSTAFATLVKLVGLRAAWNALR